MRRSLVLRLLGASLAVAICAIAATAWLTYRITTDDLQDEVDRVLETDASIYEQLITYAEQHPTWDEVGPFVDDLSERTGRRIALTTSDGAVLADSAPGSGDEEIALPSAPSALIEVRAGSTGPQIPSTPLAPAPAGEEVPPPTPHELRANDAFVDALTTCLAEAGIPHEVHDLGDGLRTVTSSQSTGTEGYGECESEARQRARDRVTADPALLYVGTPAGRLDPISAAGSGDTIATILAVVAVTFGVTIVAARRLLRPVRALITAARRMDEIATLAHAFNAMADAAERNERARRAMVNDVAHELRNPLANIRGHLEAAQDDILPFDRALADSLLEEAGILERLTSDLRDLALADAGRLQLQHRDIELTDLADQVVNAARARAAAAGVTLLREGSAPIGLRADPTRLRQALGNLVDNALRYTAPGGTIRVVVSAGEDVASVAVADSGIGIEPDDLEHLFDRFYRADASRSRRTGGSGLGLAITRHLIEAHGGEITVASEVGRGSTFTIALPRDASRRDRPTPGSCDPDAGSRRHPFRRQSIVP
jgi:two-component system, OmpR family, sensor histidine kinase BaeS